MYRIRFRVPLFAVVFLALILLGARVSHAQSFRVVCDIWPPYQIEKGKLLSGLSVDLVRGVFDQMGAKIESLEAYPWKRALIYLEEGRADALFLPIIPRLEQHTLDILTRCFLIPPWIIWSQGNEQLFSLDDLKGKRVGVVLGYSYTKEFWKFLDDNCIVESVPTDRANFHKLSLGRVDAVVAEYGNGVFIIEDLGLQGIQPHWDIEVKRDGLYLIFNKENVDEAFVHAFSEELKRYKASPAYSKLYDKYLRR